MSVTISGDGTITGIPLNKRIETFTSSGTWTVPAGVTYAIAHMLGGGGGSGSGFSASPGGASSVAFSGGTVSANGALEVGGQISGSVVALAGPANTGATSVFYFNGGLSESVGGFTGPIIVAGDTVTPGASVTVTVGDGGAAGTGGAAGGSGYVFIEYYV